MKRLVSSIMAFVMMVSLGMTSFSVYAQETPAPCICTEACEEGKVNLECPVCLEDFSQCAKKEIQDGGGEPEAPKTPEAPETPEVPETPEAPEGPQDPSILSNQISMYVSTEEQLKAAFEQVNAQVPQEKPVKIVLENDIELSNAGFVRPF